MQGFNIDQLVRFLSHLLWIYLAFWSLNALNLSNLFKKNHERQVKIALILFSIGLGYLVSSFFYEILQLSRSLFISRL
ncbi:DUF1146 family protein [Enterococcus columbae]|uniref:Integral membrane protein n=1 Tax=Enterococcus columbae DSM 7374 = ATCC 51263 TaxID=1121865 RepID=S0KVF7_9ENTE|nr:DUF1146 family protein [Enterococcus columbae]EOT44970.1 hypothetical protein OMW_00157 [Enterococcus columbae DSM 7374 = ATCC 51263]EOW84263.1 hypothetical protein I568_00751 [Enterococcus columbae DSM 7374 = ATCC 51263]OJG25014.1 hypothetical protein RR47_GL002108 [Enterococcus columbae DSM 7374 = ATCC 51263]